MTNLMADMNMECKSIRKYGKAINNRYVMGIYNPILDYVYTQCWKNKKPLHIPECMLFRMRRIRKPYECIIYHFMKGKGTKAHELIVILIQTAQLPKVMLHRVHVHQRISKMKLD